MTRAAESAEIRARHWPRLHVTGWAAIAAALLASAALLAMSSSRFGPIVQLIDMPSATLGVGLGIAGLCWLGLLPLLAVEERDRRLTGPMWLSAMIAAGLAMRLLLFTSTPAMEDDYYRYLWEGGLVVHGMSPYEYSPDDARAEDADTLLGRLALEAGPVLERVNHSHLRTIYPPVAQAAFALAHVIAPWSLTAWRVVLIAAEAGTLALLIGLLRFVGRSPLWAALYWWNPIVIKEIANSAHMEGVLMLLVVAAVSLYARGRTLAAICMLGLAIGTKLWPLLLAPLLLRPLLGDPRRLALAVAVLAAMLTAFAWPIIDGGLDETSGFVAFAEHWQTNSALFPALYKLLAQFPGTTVGDTPLAGRLARGLLGLAAAGVAIGVAVRAADGSAGRIRRAATVIFALVLVSPAQFPWYMTWMIPFLAFRPSLALALVMVTSPLYYTLFHFSARGTYEAIFLGVMVWVIWVPVWLALAIELWRGRRAAQPSGSHHA